MKDNNYYVIQGWMVNQLNLKGNDLLLFAIIYGFSQDGESEFTGSLNYLCQSMNCSRNTAKKALLSLADKGLIKKIVEVKNNIVFNKYSVIDGVGQKLTEGGSVSDTEGGQFLTEGGSVSDPNNTINNNTINNINNNINKKRFNFRNSLIENGADGNLVSEWLKIRKKKQATNSQIALDDFLSQVNNSELGINKVLEQCVINSWKGFKSNWVQENNLNNFNKNSYEKQSEIREIRDIIGKNTPGI